MQRQGRGRNLQHSAARAAAGAVAFMTAAAAQSPALNSLAPLATVTTRLALPTPRRRLPSTWGRPQSCTRPPGQTGMTRSRQHPKSSSLQRRRGPQAATQLRLGTRRRRRRRRHHPLRPRLLYRTWRLRMPQQRQRPQQHTAAQPGSQGSRRRWRALRARPRHRWRFRRPRLARCLARLLPLGLPCQALSAERRRARQLPPLGSVLPPACQLEGQLLRGCSGP